MAGDEAAAAGGEATPGEKVMALGGAGRSVAAARREDAQIALEGAGNNGSGFSSRVGSLFLFGFVRGSRNGAKCGFPQSTGLSAGQRPGGRALGEANSLI